jgi:hypothetical protein
MTRGLLVRRQHRKAEGGSCGSQPLVVGDHGSQISAQAERRGKVNGIERTHAGRVKEGGPVKKVVVDPNQINALEMTAPRP